MSAIQAQLRKATSAVLCIAFAFGVLTLWIPAAWPFAVFEGLVLALTSVWLTAGAFRPGVIEWSPWLALPLGAVVIGLAQFASGHTQNAWETRRASIEWFTHAAVAFLVCQTCRDAKCRLWLLKTFALGAGALALLATAQHYTAPGRMLWLFDSGFPDLVFGPFVYHTKLANFAELAIPCALWLAARDRPHSLLYGASAAILTGSVVAAASRGGILIIGIELALIGLLVAREQGAILHRPASRGVARPAVAFAAALVITVVVFGWELAAQRLTSSLADELRWPILLSSLDMARRFWRFGCGLGTWSTVYPEFARFDVHVFVNQAHCDWLQWTAEGGIALPLLAVAMLTVVLRAARREWWVVGLAVVWLHGFFDYPMQQTPALASLQIAFFGAAAAIMRGSGAKPCPRGYLSPADAAPSCF